MLRQWQRDLDDPGSEIAVRERARAAAVTAPPNCINVTQYVRECLDGLVADIDLPNSYPFAQFGEATVDGFTTAQHPVFQQIEAAIVRRTRPLAAREREQLAFAFALEWNRRAELEETRDRHAEWLADFQAGQGTGRIA